MEETAALFDGSETVADISLRAAVFAGIDSHAQTSDQTSGAKTSEIYQLDSPRYGCITPSPLSQKRVSIPKKFADMPYILDVAKPEEVHAKMP